VSDAGDVGAPDDRLIRQLERARDLGLLGPGPIEPHLDHATGFLTELAEVSGRVVDLGSGGGVPGLILAMARPDLEMVLLDASARRVAFLESAVAALGIVDRCRVELGRAEVIGRGPLRASADAVVARSFGPPSATAECAAPLLRVGGLLIVSEPPDLTDRWPAASLVQLGLVPVHRSPGRPQMQVLLQQNPCPSAFPRRDGTPAKRPLF
jgi:16S rRNA (guanine527-N7)-methyltransferase